MSSSLSLSLSHFLDENTFIEMKMNTQLFRFSLNFRLTGYDKLPSPIIYNLVPVFDRFRSALGGDCQSLLLRDDKVINSVSGGHKKEKGARD